MSAQSQNLIDLRQTIYDLLNDLGTIFTLPHEKGDLGSISFFYNRLHPETIRLHSIEKLLPYKNKIMTRDISYFDDNQYIFAGLPEKKIEYYRNEIIVNNRLSNEDMDIMWQYLDTILALTETLVHDKSG